MRQGNDNVAVEIYRYVTEGSFDAYMWQALETKARFIAQVMTGASTVRTAEDMDKELYDRGIKATSVKAHFLDRAPFGRNERDPPQMWLRRHDEYQA